MEGRVKPLLHNIVHRRIKYSNPQRAYLLPTLVEYIKKLLNKVRINISYKIFGVA